MKRNPYAAKFITKEGGPIPENLRFKGQKTPAVAASGEFNASSKKDLILQIKNLVEAHNSGQIVRASTKQEAKRKVAKERRAVLAEAYHNEETFKALGEVIAEDIQETTSREGFARKLLGYKDIQQGEDAKVRFRKKEIVAYSAATATEVTPTIVRENFLYPAEIYISGNILIEERDIHQSTGDILEEKYQEGLEAIIVQEDLLWKKMADESSQIINTPTFFTNLTPMHMSQIKTQVTSWGIPVAECLMAYDIWDDMIGTNDFSSWFDPVTQHELVLDGELGILLGMNLLTDAFRLPELKVLEPGELYVVGAPETHGILMQRGDLSSNPITAYNDGKPSRGWYIFEMISMMIVNARSVASGIRS